MRRTVCVKSVTRCLCEQVTWKLTKFWDRAIVIAIILFLCDYINLMLGYATGPAIVLMGLGLSMNPIKKQRFFSQHINGNVLNL